MFGEEQAVTPFDDVLFPIEIGAQASVAPTFSTNIVTSASGFESRNVNWLQARLRFDAGPGVRGDAELEALLSFLSCASGSGRRLPLSRSVRFQLERNDGSSVRKRSGDWNR